MPLLTPILDDRSFQQLRDELVRRIPTYTPEWTDTHPGDPGVALLELFAYLGEHVLFRFNQLPDATRIAFLRLFDIALDPPGVAAGMVVFSAKEQAALLVRNGTGVRAGKVPFRTTTEVLVQPVDAVPATRVAGVLPQDEELRARTERAVQALGLTETQQPVYYTVQTLAEDPTSPDAAPLEPARSVDSAAWFAILRREQDRRPPVLSDTTLTIGFIPARQVPAIAEVKPCPGSSSTPPSPPMVWRATTPDFADGRLRYVPVAVVGDTTAGLTTKGTVSLRLPAGTGMPVLPDPALTGTSTLPPALGDDRDARVLLWLQVGRPESVDAPIVPLAWAGVNAAAVEQVQLAPAELIGVGTGEADQRYRLVHRGVRPGTLDVDVEESGQWCRWQQIDDLAASRAGRHYLCDPEAGEIRFGDGFRGRAPQLGQRIRVLGYQYGGGADGNVAAAAISTVEATAELNGVKVSNPWPTSGGAPAETQPEALDRIPGELRRRDRAVTSSDFRDLALRTPGAEVARAECLPLFDPRRPGDPRAGVVSVIVWPTVDRHHPNAPTPDRALLGRVCQHLDARRLVTTELYVLPPTYRRIAVSVGLQVKPGHGVEAVRRWVELVLRQFLAPVPPFGPEGSGWPLGRRVHAPELEAAAVQVEGVQYLEGLRLSVEVPGATGPTWQERTGPPTLDLAIYEVPELAEITVVTGPPLAPGDLVAPPPTAKVPVPIPVEQDEC